MPVGRERPTGRDGPGQSLRPLGMIMRYLPFKYLLDSTRLG